MEGKDHLLILEETGLHTYTYQVRIIIISIEIYKNLCQASVDFYVVLTDTPCYYF